MTAISGSGSVLRCMVSWKHVVPPRANQRPYRRQRSQANELQGSKIRIGPNTVLFNTPEAYRDIYNYKANVKKNKTYDAWRRNEHDANTLNVTDVAIHAKKRKLLNTVFSDKAVRSALEFVIKHLDRWNELTVTGDDWSEPINLTKW
ncbi:MAG: hypothetical protein Q9226_009248, partial [Calogaya cf. arnoldii]